MASGGEIRIIVIDDQAVVRQGFVSLISTVPDMRVIAEGTNGREAVALYREHRPDVVLMDLRMPGMGGVEAIAAIRREFSDAKVIVLTTYDGDEDIYRSLQAGAQGYLLKDMFFDELESAIRAVHAGGRKIPGVVAERLAGRMGGSDLTGRELEVLELIVRGRSNKEIGASLGISEATVKSHINSILGKLGVTDRTQAATTALQRGIVHLP
ncbi:MAG TPA: response regulator transcription factor [Pyrinomonadaceae bacterium]|jgi:two-component system NarL family response regulator|nr:response regulator transcription factor [Pyrinomonadaceae bacterium]